MQTIVAVPLDTDCDTGSDDAALAQVARHQTSAFATLYHRYRDRIYWYVRTRTPTEEDAADLTQQIFAQALDALTQYRPQRGSFAAWLFAIARHALTDFHRRYRPTVAWDLVPGALQPSAPPIRKPSCSGATTWTASGLCSRDLTPTSARCWCCGLSPG